MEDSLSFMNWGFAPSKNASGWVLCETGYYWWNDMRWRDAKDFEIAGRNYNINSIKKLIIRSVMQAIDTFLYDKDNLQYLVIEDGVIPFGEYFPIKILNKEITLPNFWSDYFPEQLPNCDNYYIFDCVDEIPDDVKASLEVDSIWYEVVIEPFLLKELEGIEEKIIEITKNQNPKYPKLIANTGIITNYDIETTSIWLTSIQEL